MRAAPRRRGSDCSRPTLVDAQNELVPQDLKPESTHGNEGSEDSCRGIHVAAKPIGPACNLICEYCFYLGKKALFGPREDYRMPDDVLAAFIRGYIEAQPTPAILPPVLLSTSRMYRL
jgi:hypothetical protein